MHLLPYVDLVHFKTGQLLLKAAGWSPRVYFPVTAVVTLGMQLPDGASIQVAMIGSEGMVGLSLVAGVEMPGLQAEVQHGGALLSLEAARLAQELGRGASAARVLLRYQQSLIAQMAQIALCNRHHSIEQQLARWLLTAADRLGSREIEITQEHIAGLLGVRREGVSEAARHLRDAGLVACRRGRFTLVDTPGLRTRACACYAMQAAVAARPASGDSSTERGMPGGIAGAMAA
jgi:CRP-like cAMP-binding protein